MKKLLVFIVSLVLFVGSFSATTFAVNNDGVYDDDNNSDSTIALYLITPNGYDIQSKTGDYQLGDDFYFRVNIYATNAIKGDSLVRKINFMDEYGEYDQDVSDFMFREGGDSNFQNDYYINAYDCYKFRGTKADLFPSKLYNVLGNHSTYFKVKFNSYGRHIIEYSATSFEKGYRLTSQKYIDIYRDGTFRISTYEEHVEPPTKPTYTVFIDGAPYKSGIKEGSDFDLPASTNGFYDRSTYKCYGSHYQLQNIDHNYNLYSMSSISVSNINGANIRADGKHGIRFGSKATIKNNNGKDITEEVLKTGAVHIGTTIVPYDFYSTKFEENISKSNVDLLDPDGLYHFDVLNAKDDWPLSNGKPNYGTCYAGVVNVKHSHLTMEFMASAYVQITYENYDRDPYVGYLDSDNAMNTVRSIVGVAKRMKAAGYPGCSAAQIAVLEEYCKID